MIITVHNDRPAHVREPDVVASRKGVFAELTPEETTEPEKKRMESPVSDVEVLEAKVAKQSIWSPGQILERLTKLYQRLRPARKAGKSE